MNKAKYLIVLVTVSFGICGAQASGTYYLPKHNRHIQFCKINPKNVKCINNRNGKGNKNKTDGDKNLNIDNKTNKPALEQGGK